MPLYFAYGANMSVEGMRGRCPRGRPLGVARLMRHRLTVMREGWLSATRDPRGCVHGVLWELALSDIGALDRFEGVGEGLYVKGVQPVVFAGGAKRALVYFGSNSGPGAARPDYLDEVIAAARAWRLPEADLAALGATARAGRPGAPR
jgi:Gamma-glutamyl cyclotransferase, AIG2-like